MIKIPEDRAFLLAQRKKGRPRAMLGVDLSLTRKEKAQTKKREHQLIRKNKQDNDKVKLNRDIVLESASSSSVDSNDYDITETETDVEGAVNVVGPTVKKRGRKVILTPSVLASLDRTKVSDCRAVQIIAQLLNATGQCIDEFSLNRSSVRRCHQLDRSKRADELKANLKFNPEKPMVLHWDGKLMKDLTWDEKVDRLPILVSGSGMDQLLSIPKLHAGTGKAMADAVYEVVCDWDIKDRIKAISFDTTAGNTGQKGRMRL